MLSNAKGNDVVTEMEKVWSARPDRSGKEVPDFHFFKADLSRMAGMKEVSEEIIARAAGRGVDHLFLSQGKAVALFEIFA